MNLDLSWNMKTWGNPSCWGRGGAKHLQGYIDWRDNHDLVHVKVNENHGFDNILEKNQNRPYAIKNV